MDSKETSARVHGTGSHTTAQVVQTPDTFMDLCDAPVIQQEKPDSGKGSKSHKVDREHVLLFAMVLFFFLFHQRYADVCLNIKFLRTVSWLSCC